MCFSGNIWNRVGALYDSSLTAWSKIGHGATFPSVADHLGLLHLVSSVAGVGTHLLTVVHNGKPKSQDNQHRHCFNSRSFPAWIYWDGRGVPSFSVLQYLLLCIHLSWCNLGSFMFGSVSCILVKELQAALMSIRSFQALTMPGAYAGILFLLSGVKLFILFSSHLVIFTGWSSALYSTLNKRLGLEPCLSCVSAVWVVCELCLSSHNRSAFFPFCEDWEYWHGK